MWEFGTCRVLQHTCPTLLDFVLFKFHSLGGLGENLLVCIIWRSHFFRVDPDARGFHMGV